MTDPRPDLDTLRRQHQVADDAMTTFTPRFLGFALAEGRRMTATEAEMLGRLGLPQLNTFRNISEDALAEARAQFPPSPPPGHVPEARAREWTGTDGHLDAFRHAYWSARLTHAFGEDWARAFTTAHEAVPGNRPTPEAMDLYNNSVGVRIAREHPGASPAQLATLVADAVRDGRMVVVDRHGRLEWSDRVAVGQHGVAPAAEPPLDGRLPVPGATDPGYGARSEAGSGRHPAANGRLADEPALQSFLAALQSGAPERIREASAGLVHAPAAEQALAAARNQLARQDPAHEPTGRSQPGPALG
jgi:hypothetical protein